MPWNLTEDEQRRIMEAAGEAIKPWLGRGDSTILWQNEDGTTSRRLIHPVRIRDDAPPEIKTLEDVYLSIVEKSALIGRRLDPPRRPVRILTPFRRRP